MTKSTPKFNRMEFGDRINEIRRKIAVIGVAIEGYENQPDPASGLVDLCADARDALQELAEEIQKVPEVSEQAA
jgi:hypothetical protein